MTAIDHEYFLAFPKLSPSEIETLAPMATLCSFEDGAPHFLSGQRRASSFYVVESGAPSRSSDDSGPRPKQIVVHRPREFTGDVALLTDRPAAVSAFAIPERPAGPTASTRSWRAAGDSGSCPELSDKLLEAFQMRRFLLERSGFVGVRVFGLLGDPALTTIREFFDKNKVPHTWIDADDAQGQAAMKVLGVETDQLPFVSCNRGTRAPRPTVTRLAECLGLKRAIRPEPFDLVIVGAGPAGLAAAVYGASEGLSTLVLDRFGPGGQAGTSSRIENYMGFPAGLTGADLANRGYLQALKFGAELVAPVEVCSMTCEDRLHRLVLDDEQVVRGRTVLIATGSTPTSHSPSPVASGGTGPGSSTPAPRCTHLGRYAPAARAVVGGGNSAGQAAMFLAEHTAGVSLVLRGGDLRKSMSDYLARRIERHANVEVATTSRSTPSPATAPSPGSPFATSGARQTRDLGCSAYFSSSSARSPCRMAPCEHRRRFQGLHPHRRRGRTIRSLAPDGPHAVRASRPPARASSPRATSGAIPRSASPSPSATERLRSPARTACWRSCDSGWLHGVRRRLQRNPLGSSAWGSVGRLPPSPPGAARWLLGSAARLLARTRRWPRNLAGPAHRRPGSCLHPR